MEIFDFLPDFSRPRVVVLGTFDGLHIGHRRIIQEGLKLSNKFYIPLTILTFHPSPEEFFENVAPYQRRLLTRYDKLNIINNLEVDVVCELAFDEKIMKQTPEQFIEEILLGHLQARVLCVGYDFKFGYDRRGNTELIKSYRSGSLEVKIVPPVKLKGEPVGSSRARSLIRTGDLGKASELLGRPYTALETHQKGRGRGKSLGFPTLNFSFKQTIRPRFGVYLVWLGRVRRQPAVANFGIHPTMDELDEPVIEIHTLGQPPEVSHGEKMHIYFEQFCRREENFSSREKLQERMAEDVEKAKNLFEQLDKPKIIHEAKVDLDK